MAKAIDVKVRVRVRGLWRVTLLGWAIRLFGLGPSEVTVYTEVADI